MRGSETYITTFQTTQGNGFERWSYKKPQTCLRKQRALFENPMYKAATGRVIGQISVKQFNGKEYITIMEG